MKDVSVLGVFDSSFSPRDGEFLALFGQLRVSPKLHGCYLVFSGIIFWR